MDYLNYYGLKEDPFKLTPDPGFFFPAEGHNLALKALDYSTETSEGFSLVTGEPGTGKTTLIKVFCQNWLDRADIALILTPALGPEDFIQAVLDELKINLAWKNKNELLKAFRDNLLEKASAGRKVIIIVDEAQNLPEETLEELRTLSNLETEKEKLLQIILVGQPELRKKLRSERLRQLDQRIYTRVDLGQLTVSEVREYINYRLIKAGRPSVRFDNSAIRLIYEKTSGVPRQINILAQRALMSAYMDDSKTVTKEHIKTAIESIAIEFKRSTPMVRITNILVGTLIGLLLIFVSGYLYLGKDLLFLRSEAHKITNTPEAPVERPRRKPTIKGHLIVTAWKANLREGPSLEAKIIGRVTKGTFLEVLSTDVDKDGRLWYEVRAFGDKSAWISAITVAPLEGV